MTIDHCKQILSDYIEAEVERRVKDRSAQLMDECCRLNSQLNDADALANAEYIKRRSVEQERDEARDEGRHLIQELCNTRDELSHLRDELEFYRADAGYWKGLFEKEKRLRLDERQQLLEEGGIDRFWAMLSRVMQADITTATIPPRYGAGGES